MSRPFLDSERDWFGIKGDYNFPQITCSLFASPKTGTYNFISMLDNFYSLDYFPFDLIF